MTSYIIDSKTKYISVKNKLLRTFLQIKHKKKITANIQLGNNNSDSNMEERDIFCNRSLIMLAAAILAYY